MMTLLLATFHWLTQPEHWLGDEGILLRLGQHLYYVLVSMAVLMTVGVYGLVAAIVKMDDFGIHLSQKSNPARAVGRGILWFAPWFMRGLSIAGTVAMFLVGGGILAHGVHAIQHEIDDAGRWVGSVPGVGDLLGGVVPTLLTGLLGLVAGAVVVAIVVTAKRLRRKPMA